MIALILRELRAARLIVIVGAALCLVSYALVHENEDFFRKAFHVAVPILHSLVIVLLVERVFGRESREKGRRLVALLPARNVDSLVAKLAALALLVLGSGLLLHGLWLVCFELFPTTFVHRRVPTTPPGGFVVWQAMLCATGFLAALIVPTGSGSVALSALLVAGTWLGIELAMSGFLANNGFDYAIHEEGLVSIYSWCAVVVFFCAAMATYLGGRLHLSAGRRVLRMSTAALVVAAAPFLLWGGVAFADWVDLSRDRDDLEICAMSLLRGGDRPAVSLTLRRSDHPNSSVVICLDAFDLTTRELSPIAERASLHGVDTGRGVFDVIDVVVPPGTPSERRVRRFRLGDPVAEEIEYDLPSLRDGLSRQHEALVQGVLAGPYAVRPDVHAIRKTGNWVSRVVELDVETGEEVRHIATVQDVRRTVERYDADAGREFAVLKHSGGGRTARYLDTGQPRGQFQVSLGRRPLLSRDGRFLVMGGLDHQETIVVEIETGRVRHLAGMYWSTSFDVHGRFSPDGRFLVLVSLGEGRPVYELATGRKFCMLPRETIDCCWTGETLVFATSKTVEAVIPADVNLEDESASPATASPWYLFALRD